jgi:transcriptional regulator with XRE-family HTH domain
MSDFSQRLHEVIDFNGLLQKEVAARAGIKKRALDMYLGYRHCMPPADIAVKIASTLGVTVEYLITGKTDGNSDNMRTYLKYRDIVDKLPCLSENSLKAVRDIIKTIAANERTQLKENGNGA